MAIGLALNYKDKVKSIRPESLIAYYPLDEERGTAIGDHSLQANHGTATSVILADDTGPDGLPAPRFDGTNSYINIYSSALDTDFSETTGSASVWVRVLNSAQLENTTRRGILALGADTSNIVYIERTTTANTFRIAYIGGGTTDSVSPTFYKDGSYEIPWVHLGVTWDVTNNELKAYVNGVQSGTTQASLGTWSGALASTLCTIGAINTTPASGWSGWIKHVAIWNAELSADDMLRLGTMA